MTLPGLALRNSLLRNKTRAVLAILGVAALTMAFMFIRTVVSAFQQGPENARANRLVVRSRISLAVSLPLADFDKIKAVPGIAKATYSNWFGGTYIDPRNFFPKFAIDENSYFDVYSEDAVDPAQLAAFKADRTGCLVGEKLAKKFGFKTGDTIKIKGDIYPGDWAFHVDGLFTSTDEFAVNALLFHWKYLDAAQEAARQGRVGTYTIVVPEASRGAAVAETIDSLFQGSAFETKTESEKTFLLAFVSGSGALIAAMQTVSLVLLLIMLLILGNTLMMALRERTNELGVLRTLGFHPKHLLSLSLQEGIWLSLIGGALGVAIAPPLVKGMAGLTEGFINGALVWRWVPPAMGIAVLMGLVASLLPAVQASRINIVQALRRID